nr:MAG TPA: hypothetical protein [Caudoviricetes sp.]
MSYQNKVKLRRGQGCSLFMLEEIMRIRAQPKKYYLKMQPVQPEKV